MQKFSVMFSLCLVHFVKQTIALVYSFHLLVGKQHLLSISVFMLVEVTAL